MKKLAGIAIALLLMATPARALTIGDGDYIGNVVNGAPASLEWELLYINSLLGLPSGTAPTPCALAPNELCNRLLSTLDTSLLGVAKIEGAVKNDTDATLVDVTGFDFLIAKYGQGSFVWFVGNLTGVQEVPTLAGPCGQGAGCGLSHTSLFHDPPAVPDGGTTVSLLGLSMLGLVFANRKR